MKKQLYLIPIFLVSLLVSVGCADQTEQLLEEGTQLNETTEAEAGEAEGMAGEEFPEPPELTVIAGGEAIEALLGTYSWSIDNEDGTITAIESDTAPPPDLVRAMTPVAVTSDTVVELEFEVDPDRYTVRTWEEDYTVSSSRDDVLLTRDGPVIYEVRASWSQGTATYAFILDIN